MRGENICKEQDIVVSLQRETRGRQEVYAPLPSVGKTGVLLCGSKPDGGGCVGA